MQHMKLVGWFLIGTVFNVVGAEVAHRSSADWNNEGSRLYAASDYKHAEQCFEEARQLAAAETRTDNEELATILFNLAAVYRAEARYQNAERLYKQSLALRRDQNGPEALGVWNGLTLLYLNEGKLLEADAAGRKAVAVKEGPCSVRVSDAMNNLALVLLAEHRDQEAEKLAGAVLSKDASSCEGLDLQRGTADDTLGRIRLRQLNYVAAGEYFEQAATLIEKSTGPHSVFAASVWNDLGRVKAAQGDWAGAEAFVKRSVGTLEAIYGNEHPEVAASLSGLAEIYQSRKQYAKAETLYERVLAIDEKTTGTVSMKAAQDLNNMGSLAFQEHQWDRAESLFSRSLDIYGETQGPKSLDAGTLYGNLAVLYWHQRKFEKAEPLFQKAVEIRESYFGRHDPILANLLLEYASALRSDRHYAEAEMTEAHAMKIQVGNMLRVQ